MQLSIVSNNPALLLPLKDDQAIDISIAVSLLALDSGNRDDIKNWLSEILERARFAYTANGRYPCILHSYSELLMHPKRGDDGYRKNVTAGSILYPIIALWAALLDDDGIYDKVALCKKDHLRHRNFHYGIQMIDLRSTSIRTVKRMALSYPTSLLTAQSMSFWRRCSANAIRRPILRSCRQ